MSRVMRDFAGLDQVNTMICRRPQFSVYSRQGTGFLRPGSGDGDYFCNPPRDEIKSILAFVHGINLTHFMFVWGASISGLARDVVARINELAKGTWFDGEPCTSSHKVWPGKFGFQNGAVIAC